jgi:hypothetical protein
MAQDFHATAVVAIAAEALKVGDIRKATALYRSILEHHSQSPEASVAMNFLVVRRAAPHRDLEPATEFVTAPTNGSLSSIWPFSSSRYSRTTKHFTNT